MQSTGVVGGGRGHRTTPASQVGSRCGARQPLPCAGPDPRRSEPAGAEDGGSGGGDRAASAQVRGLKKADGGSAWHRQSWRQTPTPPFSSYPPGGLNRASKPG